MWWPFGKGSAEIRLDKYEFSPGETIKGNVKFTLKKVVHAKAVNIRLVGERKQSNFGSQRKTFGNKGYVFDFIKPLDMEKDYSGEFSYDFEINIPSNVLNQLSLGDGVAGTLIKSAQILSGTNTYINWYVTAYLDIPAGIDVSKKVQINIS